ncbi:MAG: FAD-dependent oxidoreductase [Gammaproteobacteria bacterium]|nr:FAD-dependent oxidoreductase [Gammaproteobacteria bacterium]
MNTSSIPERYAVLFEPVEIGPVVAKNRFYQVPHCTGMGWQRPRMLAEMRGTKAEGGWGVVCTEWCSVHPSSDDLPYPNASLWNTGDIKAHALMTEKVHAHDALAGVELWLGGARPMNLYARDIARDVGNLSNLAGFPSQSRSVTKSDIRDIRRWHREAALRAREAEFDIVYVYATHDYLLSHFLSRETNTRIDEYGGSLENRVRLIRELIEETREAVGDRCAVAVRFSADQPEVAGQGPNTAEQSDMLALLAELPDLWDINISDYSREMGASRFVGEGALEHHVAYVKSITTKPVVTVGRFTSPDTMVAQVRRGICDFIGAARPSIADPFLPNKIRDNRIDDIRECIGCNICYTGDGLAVPLHCTQNPTFSEGWRRGWHPEKIDQRGSDASVLIIGAGPAGLEAARALGQRGYVVSLAEAEREPGGRVTREASLPGLSEWIRVRDYRVQQIRQLPNVALYPDNLMTAEDALAVEPDHIVIATGARWRRDGVGRHHRSPIEIDPDSHVLTPDDLLDKHTAEVERALASGSVLVFDDDHYYHASTLAEKLTLEGCAVTYVTTASEVSSWSSYTMEQARVHRRLSELGVEIITGHALTRYHGCDAYLQCVYTRAQRVVTSGCLLTVTSRIPRDTLFHELEAAIDQRREAVPTVRRIGDCDAPSIIAAAVFAGHRYARELDQEDLVFRHDRVFP